MSFSTRLKMAWGSTVSYFESFADKKKEMMVTYDVVKGSGRTGRSARSTGGIPQQPLYDMDASSEYQEEEYASEIPYEDVGNPEGFYDEGEFPMGPPMGPPMGYPPMGYPPMGYPPPMEPGYLP
ncbi:hypothetical protein DQ04_05511000 [Trypanosoma grayi]|uniref:hypothetical protein n=1 Tax=Trypanosoma grayi TaxID=71804 RepID=UPI0004F41DA6|nr:hypothetical protein DQ04_05511000 [Trypanosoma grayi]KEG09265.1 hypothetical protein DQ04_05511000 [Trypanosoma grayi]